MVERTFSDPFVAFALEIWVGECRTDVHNRVLTEAANEAEAKERIAQRFGISPEQVFKGPSQKTEKIGLSRISRGSH